MQVTYLVDLFSHLQIVILNVYLRNVLEEKEMLLTKLKKWQLLLIFSGVGSRYRVMEQTCPEYRRVCWRLGPGKRLGSLPQLSAAGCGLVLNSSVSRLGTLGKLNSCPPKRPVWSLTPAI